MASREFPQGIPSKHLDQRPEERHREGLAELEQPIGELLERFRTEIEACEYGAIIGEDASGRIPALILGNAVGALYEERGELKPKLRFLAGGGTMAARAEGNPYFRNLIPEVEKRATALVDYFQSLKTELAQEGLGPKVLVVTDTIARGHSAAVLLDAAKAAGVHLDVAAIGVTLGNSSFHHIEEMQEAYDARIEAAMPEHPIIDRTNAGKELAGIFKRDDTGDLFAMRIGERPIDMEKEERKPIVSSQEIVNDARREVKAMAERLVIAYRERHRGPK